MADPVDPVAPSSSPSLWSPTLSRRGLVTGASFGAAVLIGGRTSAQEMPLPEQERARPARTPRPQLAPARVKEFVVAAHFDLDRVREMLDQEPALLNATWDWGGGDFESALGGAAHTGQRETALLLLERGARLDLFAAAMLGYLDVVKSSLIAQPGQLHARGPHGIPLLTHAKMGGEPARPVFEYLEALLPRPSEPPEGRR